MANPSKAKGTGGEVELLSLLSGALPGLVRTPASSTYDLSRPRQMTSFADPSSESSPSSGPLQVLATRPDRGQWLMTMDLEAFEHLVSTHACEVNIEVKRYARFALHGIWEKKFGGKS